MFLQFIETPLFTQQVEREWAGDEYLEFQQYLLLRPDAGAVIPTSGGLRKVRWRLRGRGKRGGARIVYFWRSRAGQIWLLLLYSKSEQADLTPGELHALRRLVDPDHG